MNDNMIKWIKCVDEPPPVGVPVLVWSNSFWRVASRDTSSYEFYEDNDYEPLKNVVAWAHINEPGF